MSDSSSEDDFGWVTTSVSSGSRAESPAQDNIGPNGYDSDSTMHSKKKIKNENDIEFKTTKSSKKRKSKHESDDENPKRRKKDNVDVFVKTEKCAEIEPQEFHKSQDKDSFMSDSSDKIPKKKLKKKKRKHSEAEEEGEEARANSDFDQSNDKNSSFVFKSEKYEEYNITEEQCNIKKEPSVSESDFQEYKHSDVSNIKHNDSLMTDSSDKTHVKKKKKKKHQKHSDTDEAKFDLPELDQSDSKGELNISVNYDYTMDKNKISRYSINSDVSEKEAKSPKVSKKKKKKKSKEKISEDEDTSDIKEISAILKPRNNSMKSFLGSPMLNGNVSEDSMTSGARTSVKTEATPKSNKVRFENDIDHNNTIISNFLQANPNLNFIKNKKKRGMLTDNDEIWQLKIPIDIDVNNLKDNKLTINNNKCKIKVNNETYIGKLDNEETCVNALFNENDNYVIKNIKVVGTVQLHKRIPKSHVTLDNLAADEDRLISLPETKCRHPLFGSCYKSAMKLPSSIQQKLKQVLSEPSEEPKKKKKRKQMDNNPEDNVTEESVKKKKKKKRKLSEKEDDHVPRKKSKRHLNSAEALEKAIEENLFN